MEKIQTELKTQIRKVPVTAEAEEALHRMLKAINQGFTGGKVGKAELLSWIVLHFEVHSFDKSRSEIRQTYFDKLSYLCSIVEELKKAGKDGAPEPDLDKLLAPLTKTTTPPGK